MERQEGEFEEDTTCTLADSDGWQHAVFAMRRWWVDPAGEVMILAELRLTGQFWERDRFERGERTGEVVEDFRLELPQIIISRPRLEALFTELTLWFEQAREIAVELSAVPDVSLRIAFGVDQRLICKLDRPACSVRYSTGTSVTFECLAVVDQSCLRLLRDDIATVLA